MGQGTLSTAAEWTEWNGSMQPLTIGDNATAKLLLQDAVPTLPSACFCKNLMVLFSLTAVLTMPLFEL
jgi:hypothetical protein